MNEQKDRKIEELFAMKDVVILLDEGGKKSLTACRNIVNFIESRGYESNCDDLTILLSSIVELTDKHQEATQKVIKACEGSISEIEDMGGEVDWLYD